VITLTVNGEKRELEGPVKLTAFLETLDFNPRHVAVARNGTVLQRKKWPEVVLQDGDVLEIVRMVGGG
jgi:thiamine biosynthesis protein ThiS